MIPRKLLGTVNSKYEYFRFPLLSFLRALYHQAVMVQRDYNTLVHKIAGDGDFLEKTLAQTVEGIIPRTIIPQSYSFSIQKYSIQEKKVSRHGERGQYTFNFSPFLDFRYPN